MAVARLINVIRNDWLANTCQRCEHNWSDWKFRGLQLSSFTYEIDDEKDFPLKHGTMLPTTREPSEMIGADRPLGSVVKSR
jgi:hypothetical protein